VNDDFLRGAKESLDIKDRHVDSIDPDIDLGDFNDTVDEYIDEYQEFDPDMDGEMAVDLHRALPLTRRVAGDLGVWSYLTAVERPDFVRHRWKPNDGIISRERFLNPIKRNSFARLWWSAEMTIDSGDYGMTRELWSMEDAQELFEQAFGRNFSSFRPALHAFLRVAGGEERKVVRDVARKQSQILTTVVLETLNQEDAEELLEQLLNRVKSAEAHS
jgi:hypothetical protein